MEAGNDNDIDIATSILAIGVRTQLRPITINREEPTRYKNRQLIDDDETIS
jgi:hypothetical protein